MICKVCKLDHPGYVMCKAHAAKVALQKAEEARLMDAMLADKAKLLTAVRPATAVVNPEPKHVNPPVNPASSVNPRKDMRHLNEDRKAYKREYMRAYMAKRRQA